MYFRTLRVLMWKHVLVRKREYVSTFVEFFFPILPFVLIYFFKEQLFPPMPMPHVNTSQFIEEETPETKSINETQGPPCVLYTPETAFTNALMNLVGEKLNLKHLKSLRGQKQHGYYAFHHASETVFRYTKSMGPDEAVVVFHNVTLIGWPDDLSYSIRMKTPFQTDVQTFIPREDDEYERVLASNHDYAKMYEAFLKLQWAIDTSYIQMLTGENVNQTVRLQEFPHLKYANRLSAFEIKGDLLFFAANISILPAFYMFMLRLLVEKASGVEDLVKMMGVTSRTLVLSHGLNAFIPGLGYIVGATLFMQLEPNPVLGKSNTFLLILALFLHLVFSLCSALVTCFLARKAPPTALTVSSVYILMTLPAYIMNGLTISKWMVYPSGLTPFTPMAWILKEASKLEYLGPGLTYKTMMTSHFKSSGSALIAYIFFIIQILVCLILFWYFDHVIPGMYGSNHKWNFFLKKSYWIKQAPQQIEHKKNIETDQNSKYFEAPPQHLDIGVRVINVTKNYDLHVALNNLSLDVYREEITILLGHNGAGKSTLMSVIAGMTRMTKGTVLINGLDITSEQTLAQQHVGFCPQQDIFFENLSVIEHVMFFTLLNSGSVKEARKSSYDLLKKLHLSDKADNATHELSGGMKRRVQLACALAGQASVLLLDEPTSGLDVETRRALWDLLISLRGSRTLLLSTHYMEEADALGDRVAALHDGTLRCHATPAYLKRAISSGYRFSFSTIGVPNVSAITDFLNSVASGVIVKQMSYHSVTYNLTVADHKMFPVLFRKIEAKRKEFGIDSISVGTSTLEDVFLQLCSNVETGPLSEDELQGRKAPSYKKLKGMTLYLNQIRILLKRYVIFLWMNKITQIGLGVIRVVCLILLITAITNDTTADIEMEKSRLAMNPDIYRPSPDFRILYKVNGSESDLRPLSDQYPKVIFVRAENVAEDALRAGRADHLDYNNYLAGMELNDTDAKILYTTTIRHAAPVALNLMSNLLALRAVPWAGGRAITAYNHPLVGAFTPYKSTDIDEPKSLPNIKLWLFSTTTMLLSGIIFMVQLPCKEANGARHIHILAGCSPEMYWFAMLLAAVVQVLLTYVITLAIACSFLDFDDTFSDKYFIIAASVCVLLGTMAMLSFSYIITFHFSQSAAVAIIALIMVFFVLGFPAIAAIVPTLNQIRPIALVAMPPYTFNEAMMGCSMTAYLNTLCKLNREKCPALAFPIPFFSAEKCCQTKANSNAWCYFCFQSPSPGKKIVYLIVQTCIYMLIVILTQKGFFCLMWERMINVRYKMPVLRCHDAAVMTERQYVEETAKLPPKEVPDVMLVSNVHKNYHGIWKRYNAVKGVSFSVKKGECFGLLGVNGAGKSTMFNMLTAKLCPTRGRVIANGVKMTIPYRNKYLFSLGYCPQFWALDDFLTGRQSLELLLTLNGLNKHDVKIETIVWIKLVGLEKYLDRLLADYSSGCLRRLAAATALCTSAPITLLDEPTAGVDVAARRRVWYALKRGVRDNHGMIITSHNLDEIQALCHRISIMSSGEICAIGTSAELRATHADGHSIIIKIKHDLAFSGKSDPKVQKLKAAIISKFKCDLRDEHKTMLHYHIVEVMHYSILFEEMERLTAAFPDLIEDFSVSETTLEEVFLSFGKPKTDRNDEKVKKKDVAVSPRA